VLIDLSDGVDTDAPPNLLAFARRPGSRARLIPNPYLLRPRPWLGPALPWAMKRDSVYFRGASTGSTDYDANARVALCRVAKTMPRADCRVSRIKQVDAHFAARLEEEGLVGWRLPIWAMNRHRFLVEADGNSSSWDRYMLIGSFGGVPIRFECEWEECWHGLLVDGVNCVTADLGRPPVAAGCGGAPAGKAGRGLRDRPGGDPNGRGSPRWGGASGTRARGPRCRVALSRGEPLRDTFVPNEAAHGPRRY
jgi:hypothetical protein